MKRAIGTEQKAIRRDSILQAAKRCFLHNGHKLPSAAEVAKESGIAKGTVYLYFKTKEEIFLALFGQLLAQLLSNTAQMKTAEKPADELAMVAFTFIQQEPGFMALAAMLHSVLETNLAKPTLYQFKAELSENLNSAGKVIDEKYNFDSGFSVRALLHSYASLLGLWQMLQWPTALDDCRDDAVFSALQRSLPEEVQIMMTRIWAPALT